MSSTIGVRPLGWMLLGGFLFFGSTGVALQHRIIDLEKQGRHAHHLLYLPAKEYVKPAALGYDHMLSDFLFIRVIQAFGATYARSIDLSLLWSYFDTITDLDPRFLSPYSFGNLVLGETAGDREKGLAILDKGIENNPDSYKPAYDAAFYALWGLEDAELARRYVRIASATPDCPEFVRRWEAFLDERMGRYEAAFQKFLGEVLQGFNSGDSTLLGLHIKRLRISVDQWYLSELTAKAMEFEAREGRFPSVRELETAGAFRDVAWPDWPRVEAFLAGVEAGEATYDERETPLAGLMERFIRVGWDRMPPSPMSPNPRFPGYVIWPGKRPFLDDGSPNPHFAKNEFDAAWMLKEYLRIGEEMIEDYRQVNGGDCPPDLATAFPAPEDLRDPFGGEFVYDRERCVVTVSSRPDLVAEIGNSRPLR